MTRDINKEYGYWNVEEIRQYIIEDLKRRFPDSIIEREFDLVDLMVHGPNIPVEIQRTRCDPRTGNPQLSYFEDVIRRQIEQNIETYEQDSTKKAPISRMAILGIVEGECWIRCSDNYDVLKYFPGYFEKKELWDYLRIHTTDSDTFSKVIRGQYLNYLKDRKGQKEIEDIWR